MTGTGRTTWTAALLVTACGGTPEPAAPPQPEAPEIAQAPMPPPVPDAGPGGVPAPVAEALSGLFAKARRVRCEVPTEAAAEGALSAVSLASGESWVIGPTVRDGWFAGVVPAETGAATVLRDERVVGVVRWEKAAAGGWTACTWLPPTPYRVLGVVLDPAGKPIARARVHGCDGRTVTANAEGRFESTALAAHPCAFLAWVEDSRGLGRSDLQVVDLSTVDPEAGADAIVELVVPEARLGEAAVAAQGPSNAKLLEVQLRNGVTAEIEGLGRLVGASSISADARAVAEGWITDLRAREARGEKLRRGLLEGGRQGLFDYWFSER
jgi:hypothetical protein